MSLSWHPSAPRCCHLCGLQWWVWWCPLWERAETQLCAFPHVSHTVRSMMGCLLICWCVSLQKPIVLCVMVFFFCFHPVLYSRTCEGIPLALVRWTGFVVILLGLSWFTATNVILTGESERLSDLFDLYLVKWVPSNKFYLTSVSEKMLIILGKCDITVFVQAVYVSLVYVYSQVRGQG